MEIQTEMEVNAQFNIIKADVKFIKRKKKSEKVDLINKSF
jgi:hypothetical protein